VAIERSIVWLKNLGDVADSFVKKWNQLSLYRMCTNKVVTIPTKLVQPVHAQLTRLLRRLSNLIYVTKVVSTRLTSPPNAMSTSRHEVEIDLHSI
jgi:hypothetical protein